MKKEIAAVVFFLKRLVKKGGKLETQKVELFGEKLSVALQEKCRGHWYLDNPSKGQAFRCIRVNKFQSQDPELLRVCEESGLQYNDLGLPQELTLWVDPGEVCCRYGEQNPAFTVASFSSDDEDDKMDVTKKVTRAVERVTSDYHSGSSDEESNNGVPAPPTSVPDSRYTHKVLNPAAPMWTPKKKLGPGKGYGPPWPHFSIPPGRPVHLSRHNGWAPPDYRGCRGYRGSALNLAHC
ncbi:protein BTG3 [Aplochiton taeniatus]